MDAFFSHVPMRRVVLTLSRLIGYLKDVGFYKQGEVAFPHKQSAVMKLDRESWEAPST